MVKIRPKVMKPVKNQKPVKNNAVVPVIITPVHTSVIKIKTLMTYDKTHTVPSFTRSLDNL